MKEFENIIGYEGIKKELIKISDVLKNNEAYKKLGVTAPRGLVLYGEPGVGKTLMASSLIEASGRKAIICRKDKPNGDFVKALKAAFKEAKESAPSVIFLDDMDKFANGDSRHRDQEEYVTVQSSIDNIKGKDVFVLATANDIDVLPESLLRAGRFDRVIEVCNPCGEDAIKIMDHYMKQKKFVGDMDASVVARMMDGYSCAELETVINEAGLLAGYERSDVITMDHFIKACLHNIHDIPTEALENGKLDADLTDGDDPVTRVIYHEAGHATVSEVLNPGIVTLVSAYSRDGRKGGFTSYSNGGDGKICSVEGRYGHICSSLGGMAALEQKFGVTDIGVSHDIEQAFTSISGLITENCAVGFDHYAEYRCSDKMTEKNETAAAAEMNRLYRKTKEILAKNRDLLDGIAKMLCDKGVITAADISKIKENCRIVSVAL